MNNNPVKGDGILVESAALMARVQACVTRAEGLQQAGGGMEAAQLDNSMDTVLSALVASNLRNRFTILPESICRYCRLVLDNSRMPTCLILPNREYTMFILISESAE
jgi:hypothetical protein